LVKEKVMLSPSGSVASMVIKSTVSAISSAISSRPKFSSKSGASLTLVTLIVMSTVALKVPSLTSTATV